MGTALLSFDHDSVDTSRPRQLRYQGGLITIHADSRESRGQFALLEMQGGPGGEPPFHVHQNEDELFHVLEGQMTAFRGIDEIILKPGQTAFLPRGVPHTFKIMSSYIRFLVYITPGGFEEYFRDLGQPAGRDLPQKTMRFDVAAMMEAARRYGVMFLR